MGTKPRLFDPEFKAETVGGARAGAIAGLGLPRFSSSMVAGATTLEETR